MSETAADPPPDRPVLLTALAWIWIALGGLFTLISLFVATVVLLYPGGLEPRLPEPTPEAPFPGLTVLDRLFAHFETLVVAQLVVAVLILVAAVFLLRQRARARTVLETVSWLGLAYAALFTGWFAWVWLTWPELATPGAAADPEAAFFRLFGAGAAVLTFLSQGIPLGALIWMLRHRTVRAALR